MPDYIKSLFEDLTEFEIDVIFRALGIGEFSITKLNFNLPYVFAHFFKYGKELSEKQIATAEKIYKLLKAAQNLKIRAGTF